MGRIKDMKRKTKKDYHKLAKSRGFRWVGVVLPKGVFGLTWWECDKNHRWQTKYSNIQRGCGCPICSNHVKKTKKDYCELAKKRGFRWIDEKFPKNTHTKTLWECENGHTWLATYHKIGGGGGCPCCFNEARRLSKNDYQVLAEERGVEWGGCDLPKNVNIKTWWVCKKNHKWSATYSDVFYNKSHCPHCSCKAKKTTKDYHALAKLRGFKFIDVLPKNISVPVKWECFGGHVWKACYGNIYSGTNCPYCQNRINGYLVSKPQIKLNGMISGALNYKVGKYRIDVAIMRRSQKIAVEYDCLYWHSNRGKEDTKRDKYLVLHDWKVLHIKSRYLIPTRKQLNFAIKHLLDTNDVVYNLYLEDWKN